MASPTGQGAPLLNTADVRSLSIRWAAPTSDGGEDITSYSVRYRTSATTNPVAAAGAWNPTAGIGLAFRTNYLIANLSPGTSYDVQVAATNNDGTSSWSSSLVVQTLEVDEMTILNADLTRLGFGNEASAGQLQAVTVQVPFTDGSWQSMLERNAIEEMRGIMADYEDVLVRRATQAQFTWPLDVENIIPILMCGVEAETPDTSGDPEVWTFTPGRTAPADLRSATIQLNESDGSTAFRRRAAYCRPTAFSIEASDGVAQVSSTWMGRTSVAGVSWPSGAQPLARTIIPAQRMQVFIDDSWAALGSTAVGTVRSMSLTYNPGLSPAYNLAGSTTLDLTDWYRARFQGAVVLTIDHDSDASGEFAHYEAGDLRYIRVEFQQGTGAGSKRLRLDHCVRYIEPPDILAADGKQHVLELTGQLRADSSNNLFQAVLNNAVTSW